MLQANNLTKKYNDKAALDQLNLTVNGGEIYCLLGANGAGKTTTINLFMNFIQPTTGEVKVNDVDVTKDPVGSKKHLSYIPEILNLYPTLTGLENLEFFTGLAGQTPPRAELIRLLTISGLQKEAINKRVSQYSKGMRQKVGIAIARAKKANNLLLDEPTSGLDPQASNDFARLLEQMCESGMAILMTTHDLFRAKETGTHIGIMKEGKLVEQVSSAEIDHSELEQLYLIHGNN